MMCVINTLSIYISYYLYLWFQQWKTINLKINFVGLDLCSGFWPSDSTYNTFFFFFFYYWCLSVFVISTAVMDSTLTSYVVSQWVCEMAARFSKCEDSDPLFTRAHSVGLFMYLSLCMLCVLTCISIIVAWLWWKTKKKKNNLNLCWCSWRNHARAHYILKISNQKNPTPLLLSHKLPRSR